MFGGCSYNEGGYCHFLGCKLEDVPGGCCNSYNSCQVLDAAHAYYGSEYFRMEKDAQNSANRMKEARQHSSSASMSRREQKKMDEAELRQIELDRKEQELKQKELKRRREQAAAQGLRIEEDVKGAKLFNRIVCFIVAYFMIIFFVVVGKIQVNFILGSGGYVLSFLLALPILLCSSFSLKFYGREEFLGQKFPGSAFLRTYLPTFLPCLFGLFVARILAGMFFQVQLSASSMIGTILIYIVVCIAAWWLNHNALPYIWKRGLDFYFPWLGKRSEP